MIDNEKFLNYQNNKIFAALDIKTIYLFKKRKKKERVRLIWNFNLQLWFKCTFDSKRIYYSSSVSAGYNDKKAHKLVRLHVSCTSSILFQIFKFLFQSVEEKGRRNGKEISDKTKHG